MLRVKTRNILLAVMTPFPPIKSDINICLKAMLDHGTQPRAMGDRLRAEVMRLIPEPVSKI